MKKRLDCGPITRTDALQTLKKKQSCYFFKQASVRELARTAYFGSLSVIPEDFVKENGGQFTCEYKKHEFSAKVQKLPLAANMGYQFGYFQ